MIKNSFKKIFQTLNNIVVAFYFNYERLIMLLSTYQAGLLRERLVAKIDNEVKIIKYDSKNRSVEIKVHTPNILCLSRYKSFSSKEPEMLEWIEEYGGNGTFYDIGACIGLYSLYYAKLHHGDVVSFEPSIFNLRQLGKNISINKMEEKITIVPNPLSVSSGFATFKNGSTTEGGALSAFGVDFGSDGNFLNGEVQYGLLGFSLDDLLQKDIITSPPSLIKVDVDGIEHLILKGAEKTLAQNSLKSVYIEVNAGFQQQSEGVEQILKDAGFELKARKKKGELVDKNFRKSHNQIWTR